MTLWCDDDEVDDFPSYICISQQFANDYNVLFIKE